MPYYSDDFLVPKEFAKGSLRDRLRRLVLIPVRIILFTLRIPIHVLAFLLEPLYRDRKEAPSWLLRQLVKVAYIVKPRVLVCMPFNEEPTEAAYQLVIKPMIKFHLGGKCTRFSHPFDGDWRRQLRRSLLFHSFVLFDLSFRNRNVYLERVYYQALLRHLGDFERRCIEIQFVEQLSGRFIDAKTIPGNILYYNDDPIGLMHFAERLRGKFEQYLLELGFRRGTINPWVLHPTPPWEIKDPDVRWLDRRKTRELERSWVEDENLDW